MDEYLERLDDFCRLYGIVPKMDNMLNLNPHDFGTDAKEVREILCELSELYYEKCDCYDEE